MMRTLITGGTSATGEAIAQRLHHEGARIVLTGRDAERGSRIAERVGGTFVCANARDGEQIRRAVRVALDTLGGLDALVLATGVLHQGQLSQTSDAAWDELIETNLLAAWICVSECLPALRDAGGASIVAVSSAAAVRADTSSGAYAVSKGALLALSEMLAVEAAPNGVRVNAVCPGDSASGMSALVERSLGDNQRRVPLPPLGRFARASDVADAVAHFLSDAAVFSTGAMLLVDGGMRAADCAWTVASG